MADNYYTALNSAVFSDGSFVYVPKGVKSPMELSTYFRINAENTGQFERTLIIAEEGSYVSYLEGCTAPAFDDNQLHAAVVELSAAKNAEIKYSTVQNWYAGDDTGKGGIYNFVTKRGLCHGDHSKISWTQVCFLFSFVMSMSLVCSVLTLALTPAGGDRFSNHLEISIMCFERR